jgi:hypothetical protein
MVPACLLPFVTTKSDVIGLALNTPVQILAATGRERWIIAFSVGNSTCPISIESGAEVARIYGPGETCQVLICRKLGAPVGALTMTANGAASPAVSYTLVYADAPNNVVLGSAVVIGPG